MNVLSKKCGLGSGVGLIWVVLAMFGFAHPVTAMYAYLPMVGAPELRIEVVTTNSFNYLVFSKAFEALEAKTAEALSNASAMATDSATNANNTNSSATIASAAPQTAIKSETSRDPSAANVYTAGNPSTSSGEETDPEKGGRQPGNFSFPSSSASDLLTVTPQMMTQYLKPEANETNQMDRPGAVVFVPADMPFMPPTQRNAPESRAIYQSR